MKTAAEVKTRVFALDAFVPHPRKNLARGNNPGGNVAIRVRSLRGQAPGASPLHAGRTHSAQLLRRRMQRAKRRCAAECCGASARSWPTCELHDPAPRGECGAARGGPIEHRRRVSPERAEGQLVQSACPKDKIIFENNFSACFFVLWLPQKSRVSKKTRPTTDERTGD
jgi:hypothetical protein